MSFYSVTGGDDDDLGVVSLPDLPLGVLHHVFSFLNAEHVFSVSSVNRYLFQAVQSMGSTEFNPVSIDCVAFHPHRHPSVAFEGVRWVREHVRSVRHVDLGDCPWIEDLDFLRSVGHVASLSVCGNHNLEDALALGRSLMPHYDTLRHLDLSSTGLAVDLDLARTLRECSTLTSLLLDHIPCPSQREADRLISNVSRGCQGLRKLSLAGWTGITVAPGSLWCAWLSLVGNVQACIEYNQYIYIYNASSTALYSSFKCVSTATCDT